MRSRGVSISMCRYPAVSSTVAGTAVEVEECVAGVMSGSRSLELSGSATVEILTLSTEVPTADFVFEAWEPLWVLCRPGVAPTCIWEQGLVLPW